MTIEYRESLTELNVILNYMSVEYLKKIPTRFLNFIDKNMDKNYVPNISPNVPINKQELNKDTKILLSLIYRNYWCDNETKQNLLYQDLINKKKHEQEMLEKYNPDNLFKNHKTEEVNIKEETQALVEYKEKSFIQRVMDKIKNLFNKKL